MKLNLFLFFLLFSHFSFGQNSKGEVSIELSIPHSREFAYINELSSLKKVSVIIHNNTDTTNYFYEDRSSYGYYNISFEIAFKDSIYQIIRPQRLWYQNYPSYFIVHAHEWLVFNYSLIDTSCAAKLVDEGVFENGWLGFPPFSDTVEIRAVYQLCHLENSILEEHPNRSNYGRDFYIDFLDDDLKAELGLNEKSKEDPKSDSNTKIIFHEPLFSEWQKVILR